MIFDIRKSTVLFKSSFFIISGFLILGGGLTRITFVGDAANPIIFGSAFISVFEYLVTGNVIDLIMPSSVASLGLLEFSVIVATNGILTSTVSVSNSVVLCNLAIFVSISMSIILSV